MQFPYINCIAENVPSYFGAKIDVFFDIFMLFRNQSYIGPEL
jgi:hypothetical protein